MSDIGNGNSMQNTLVVIAKVPYPPLSKMINILLLDFYLMYRLSGFAVS